MKATGLVWAPAGETCEAVNWLSVCDDSIVYSKLFFTNLSSSLKISSSSIDLFSLN